MVWFLLKSGNVDVQQRLDPLFFSRVAPVPEIRQETGDRKL